MSCHELATSNSLNKWDQLFRTEVDLTALDEARKSSGYSPILGREKPGVLDVAVEGVSYATRERWRFSESHRTIIFQSG
jgi:hypothetical protein